MKSILLMTSIHLKNSLRSKAITIAILIFTLAFAGLINLLGYHFFIAPELSSPAPDPGRILHILSLILYSTGILSLGLNLNVFSARPMMKEKTQRIYETLLAAPTGPVPLWVSRGLAVFLPGLVLSLFFTSLSMISIEVFFIIPRLGFLLSPWLIVTNFITVSLMYLFLTLITQFIGLAHNPIPGVVLANVFMSGILSVMINLGLREIFNAAAWDFALINLIITAVLGILMLTFKPLLTKERIILSGGN
ncbi:MAG: hypothetical protein JW969_02210 [Spirochaetales bacterium]|nr:hypothetical protein [Spirochaetales bacterium]